MDVYPDRLIDYPFPMREGLTSVISLPSLLTPDEADRVVRYIESLVIHVDAQPEDKGG